MKREDHFEIVYINDRGETCYCYPRSIEQRDRNVEYLNRRNMKIVRITKLYPFNTYKNQHNFDLINNICANTMYDMESGEIEWDDAEFERLEKTRRKAQEFFAMPLPIAWVPWPTYKAMKEMSAAAVCHRDEANARAQARRYADERDSDWRPGDAPWKAPGMSASDFVR